MATPVAAMYKKARTLMVLRLFCVKYVSFLRNFKRKGTALIKSAPPG